MLAAFSQTLTIGPSRLMLYSILSAVPSQFEEELPVYLQFSVFGPFISVSLALVL